MTAVAPQQNDRTLLPRQAFVFGDPAQVRLARHLAADGSPRPPAYHQLLHVRDVRREHRAALCERHHRDRAGQSRGGEACAPHRVRPGRPPLPEAPAPLSPPIPHPRPLLFSPPHPPTGLPIPHPPPAPVCFPPHL